MALQRLGWIIITLVAFAPLGCASSPSLSAWNDSRSQQEIVAFVEDVTDPGSENFVPQNERIAVFDNDGCLWVERPVYFQILFAMNRVHELAAEHPEWRTTQPFQAVLEGDMETLAASGMEGVAQIVAATHAGMTTDEFAATARDWLTTAHHPDTGRPYTEMVYEPMLQVLDYLRANGFKTYIVSGGGVEFLRVFAEEIYGIPPEQVIGTRIKTEFEMTADGPVIRRLAEIDFVDDKAGKPVAINAIIGRRPIAAFGNSDGDLQMLQWTAAGDGARLCVLVHHTDAEREYAYDRDSHVGRLDAALDEASERGWTVVDMRRDWNQVYP